MPAPPLTRGTRSESNELNECTRYPLMLCLRRETDPPHCQIVLLIPPIWYSTESYSSRFDTVSIRYRTQPILISHSSCNDHWSYCSSSSTTDNLRPSGRDMRSLRTPHDEPHTKNLSWKTGSTSNN